MCYVLYVTLWFTMYLVFFFFQAEDGIRDLTVTGVQTCALPISGTFFARTKNVPAYTVAATFESGCWMWLATKDVLNTVRTTKSKSNPLRSINRRSIFRM